MVCLSFPLSEDRRPTRSFTNIFYFFCTDAHPCILDKRDIAAGEAIRSEGGEDENEEELWKNNGHTFLSFHSFFLPSHGLNQLLLHLLMLPNFPLALTPSDGVPLLLLLCLGPVSCWQCVEINNTHGGGGHVKVLCIRAEAYMY